MPRAPLETRRASHARVSARKSSSAAAETGAPSGEIVDLAYDWQLDFCSRPMKDERGKKMWELLICDETRSFEHAEFFPNNRINSVELSKAIDRVIQAQGARPRRFKFFRSQMQTIITRACNDAGIDPLPSRRCQTLTTWLDWRVENVYKQHPGFDGQASPMMGFEASAPRPLPDALRGESWAFVALPLVGVREEIEQVKKNKVFGDVLEIDPNLPDDTLVPGIAVYTRRAAALAEGGATAAGVTLTKQLVAAPPNVVTPTALAETAAAIAAAFPETMSVKILEEAECRAMGMGAFLGVSEASDEPPSPRGRRPCPTRRTPPPRQVPSPLLLPTLSCVSPRPPLLQPSPLPLSSTTLRWTHVSPCLSLFCLSLTHIH